MSFKETQAAVCVLQPVFSGGRGRLTVQGPPVDGVDGHRLAYSVSRGENSHSGPLHPCMVECWCRQAGRLLQRSLYVIDFIDLTFGSFFFYIFSVHGGEKCMGI